MRRACATLGGLWVMICLFLRCKGKTGYGSYLQWRKETAFGKEGEFDISTSEKRRSVQSWAKWAWSMKRKHIT